MSFLRLSFRDSSVELADPLSPPVEYDDNGESGVNREIRNDEGEDEENDDDLDR